MFTALATGAARATARRRLPALAAVFVIVAAFTPMAPLAAPALAGTGGPALTPPTAESAAPDPADPHGFLDDSTTGTPGGGISPAVTTPPTVAPGFSSSIVLSGLTNPTAVRFASDGSVWVTQKNGKILRYSSLSATTPTVFADLSAEVNQYWDHGMMGLALAPNFPTDPSVYVLYSYDHNPVHDYIPSAPSTWNDGCPTPPGGLTDGCPTLGRLSRLTANAGGATWTGTETVVLQGWCQQGPSHSMDNLAFGPDGYLYASAGEGANPAVPDYGQQGGTTNPVVTPGNPCGDPPSPAGTALTAPTAEGGSLRSQSPLRTDGPAVLNGSLLRIDPTTAAGAPGNPFASSSDPIAKKILAYGLRNPFRFTFRPGFNDQIWLGDVGNATWEEINKIAVPTGGGSIASTANDFGWPCYEGNTIGGDYGATVINQCTSLVASANAIGPYYAYKHSDHVNATESCRLGSSSISGLAFYTGTSYPAAYHGALFFADHSRDCIWAMLPDGSGNPDPTQIIPVVTGAPTASVYRVGPVDLEVGPGGDIFYPNFDNGTINRLAYGYPSALIQSDVTNGSAPLAVHFDGTGSFDPTGNGLTYSWTAPGATCNSLTSATPTCTFGVGTWPVTLTVTASNSNQNTTVPYTITSGDTPPVPVIDTINGSAPPVQPSGPFPPPAIRPSGVPAFWSVGNLITFTGHATSLGDGTEPAANLSWQLVMHHCPSDCHLHVIQTWSGTASGSVAAPDHDYPSYLELMLTAVTAHGLTASSSIYLYPKTATINLVSLPAGAVLTVGNGAAVPAPTSVTFIDGGAVSLAASQTQILGGKTYIFSSWSDGGTATHTITAHDGDTYTAQYAAVPGTTFHPLTPGRILDTRDGTGGLTGPFSSHVARTFQVTGNGGVPAGATAVTGNLTVTQQTSLGFLFIGPLPMNDPTSSTLNFPQGDDRANAVTVALGGGGTLSVTYAAPTLGRTAHVIFDVTGYFTPDATGAMYFPLTPGRILDTRDGTGGLTDPFSSHVARSFQVTGNGGVPAGATAVTGNLTVTQQTSLGFLFVGPVATNNPTTSTLNFPTNDDRANAVTVALGAGGTISVTYAAPTLGRTAHVIFDVTGYFTPDPSGAMYFPLTPGRILDTRTGTGGLTGPFSSHVARSFQVTGGGVPSVATAVTGNLTVTQQTSLGFLFIGPIAMNDPTSSDLNFPQGDDRANAVTVALGSGGTLSVTCAAPTLGPTAHVIFDVTGYFAAGP